MRQIQTWGKDCKKSTPLPMSARYKFSGHLSRPERRECKPYQSSGQQCEEHGCSYRPATGRRRETCAQPPGTLSHALGPSELVQLRRSGGYIDPDTGQAKYSRVQRTARLSGLLPSGRPIRRSRSAAVTESPPSWWSADWYDPMTGNETPGPPNPSPGPLGLLREEKEEEEVVVPSESSCEAEAAASSADLPIRLECYPGSAAPSIEDALIDELCAEELQSDFVNKRLALPGATLVVAKDKAPAADAWRGFAVLNEDKERPKVLHVSALCATGRRGVGTALLTFIERLAARRGNAYLELDATPNAIAFYRRRGFVNAFVPKGTGRCTEPPAIAKLADKVQRALRTARKRGPPSSSDIVSWPTMKNLLNALVNDGLVANPACAGIDYTPREEHARPSCSEDGYRMVKCLGV